MAKYQYFKVIFNTTNGNCEGVELDNDIGENLARKRRLDEVAFADEEVFAQEFSLKDLLGLSEIQKIRFIKKPGKSICSITIGDIEFYYWC